MSVVLLTAADVFSISCYDMGNQLQLVLKVCLPYKHGVHISERGPGGTGCGLIFDQLNHEYNT